MLTQTIQINLTQSKLSSIIMRSEEKGREIAFSVIDEAGDPVALEDYSVKFLMLKPDENVIYADVVSGVLTQTEQMTTSKGAGYYCIRIIDAGTVIYSGQGRVLVDDHVIDDETLNSISEVDGYIFPDDFATHAWVEEYVDEHTSGSVIANPDTPPTDTLETVTIEDITYDIIHPAEEKSGNPIEITDAAAAPLVKCISAITGYQEGSGTPSPDNVRPIVAYTEGEIVERGKNLVEETIAQANINANGVIETGGSSANFNMQIAKVKQDVTYVITSDEGRLVCGFYTAKPIVGSTSYNGQRIVENTMTFTAPIDGYVAFRSSKNEAQPQLEEGTTATTYEPYTSTTHTTTFHSAIYRGSEDVVKGEVVTEWGMIASYAGETLPGEWISDRDEYAPGTTPTTGAQVAYKLATPTTSSVTPTNLPIKSILGYNHIESSTGEMEVEYITQRFQPLIDSIKQL